MAQNAPANTQPTRDIAVTYRVTSPWEPTHEMRMAWSITQGKLRVERPPGGREWTLLDQNTGSAVTVMEAERMIVTIPSSAAAAMTQTLPADARFMRKGAAHVAGAACTEWEVTAPQGQSTICMTEDGAVLRSAFDEGTDLFRMEATSVQYSPPPALFTVPQGFRKMPGGTAPAVQRQGR
jgi:hypothetical protein